MNHAPEMSFRSQTVSNTGQAYETKKVSFEGGAMEEVVTDADDQMSGQPGKTRPDVTVPCCQVWIEIAPHLRWFTFTDWPDLAAMPHIRAFDGTAYRVNHCLSCGAARRDAIERSADVQQAD